MAELAPSEQFAFLAAYEHCGTLSGAAKMRGISIGNHYRWLKDDAHYRAEFDETHGIVKGKTRDVAVSNLLRILTDGQTIVKRKYTVSADGEKTLISEETIEQTAIDASLRVLQAYDEDFATRVKNEVIDKTPKALPDHLKNVRPDQIAAIEAILNS